MSAVDDKRLEQLLRESELEGEAEASRRTLSTVRAAYAERAPRPKRRQRLTITFAAALLVVTGVVGLSPAGAELRAWVSETIDPESTSPRPSLTRLPAAGSLLAQSRLGTTVVGHEGSRRFLGRFDSASWSPHGLYVAGADGETLAALEPGGSVRWSISAPDRIRRPAWSRDLGYRVAYLSGARLRVVAGDGTADRALARAQAVTPAWRSGSDRVLAYVTADGSVAVVDVDSGRNLALIAAPDDVATLAWSPSGSRLLARSASEARVSNPRGETVARYEPRPGDQIAGAAFLGQGGRIAIVEHRGDGTAAPSSLVSMLEPRDGELQRTRVFQTPGLLRGLAVSPDGETIAVGWQDADQWLFLDPERGGTVRAVGNVSRQLAPGAARPPFPVPAEWCCAR